MKKFSAIVLFSGIFVFAIAQVKKPSQTKKPAAVKIKTSATKPATSKARGAVVYKTFCIKCHQVDGGGVQHLNPPLAEASAVVAKDKSKIIKVVLNGMTSKEEIDGEVYGNNMAPHNFLNDQQVADVLTFIRSSFGNKASAVTAAEVKKLRPAKKK
ncbi:MAG: cytochrome c [Chitinophagaceae bacterium]|nr:cytochrome c [Chitinophagaceae bacterium]